MRTIYHTITLLICITFLLPSLGGVGGSLYAQDQLLFDHTWYFDHGELEGNSYNLPSTPATFYSTIHLEEYNGDHYLYTSYNHCESGCMAEIDFSSTASEFEISFTVCFASECPLGTEMRQFEIKVNQFYGMLDTPSNPYAYNIVAIQDYHQLTIENDNGDWAVYNSKLLSTPNFNKTVFTLYPNPVNETLYIKNTFNQVVQTSIYDLNGKLLHSQTIENNNVTIDVKSLNQGLYFVVFENETGERHSKKFVKE